MFLNVVVSGVRWREPHPEKQKQILRDGYPIAHDCATGPQACVAQDDTDFGWLLILSMYTCAVDSKAFTNRESELV